MDRTLPERAQALFDRIKAFPEAGKTARGDTALKPDAFLAFLDLRQLMEREILPALHAHRDCGEYVAVPRLED